MKYTLTELWIYPVKSLGGIAVSTAVPETRGLRYDRRWMLVNENGDFVTQRELPEMALLGVSMEPSVLTVFQRLAPSDRINIPLSTTEHASSLQVQVWGDKCRALVMPDWINNWFSDVLKQKLRLVFMPDESRRPADDRFAPANQYVSFADAFPYLLIGQASLDALNARLSTPVPMNRFRPNLVFSGGEPFEEDTWSDFTINHVKFRGVKPCARCTVTTIDQDTAARAVEPLKTLAKFRQFGNKVLFGQNAVWLGERDGVIKVGDPITLC